MLTFSGLPSDPNGPLPLPALVPAAAVLPSAVCAAATAPSPALSGLRFLYRFHSTEPLPTKTIAPISSLANGVSLMAMRHS